jgi:UDP-MurNAc hydroxylase
MNRLYFINHASFFIESEHTLLLLDPWVEGLAFNQGWSLLDSSTSNLGLCNLIKSKNKPLFIWYSHEHSDHLSFSFLSELKKHDIALRKILFQSTLDMRVSGALANMGFDVLNCPDGEQINLDTQLFISTYQFQESEDSFCIIKSGEKVILNLNDCELWDSSHMAAIKALILKKYGDIDILFTQFGYAGWVGGEEPDGGIIKRSEFAISIQERMAKQIEIFRPKLTIPFASLVMFCHEENKHMNNEQNTPEKIASSYFLKDYSDNIAFMCPGTFFDLNQQGINELKSKQSEIHLYWSTALLNFNGYIHPNMKSMSYEDIEADFKSFQIKINRNFLKLPVLLEKIGLVRPVIMKLSDYQDLYLELSYIDGIKQMPKFGKWNIEMSSEVFSFSLKNDWGFTTTWVNSRLRVNGSDSLKLFSRFVLFQYLMRKGYGIKAPVATISVFLKSLIRKFSRI